MCCWLEGRWSRSHGFSFCPRLWQPHPRLCASQTGEWGGMPRRPASPLQHGLRLQSILHFCICFLWFLSSFSPIICSSVGVCRVNVFSASKCNPSLPSWGLCSAVNIGNGDLPGVFLLWASQSLSWGWGHFLSSPCYLPCMPWLLIGWVESLPCFSFPHCPCKWVFRPQTRGLNNRKLFSPSLGC